jgi:hypothetical protein
MTGRLEVRMWIRVKPVNAVAISADGQFAVAGLEQGLNIFDVDAQPRFHQPANLPLTVPIHRIAAEADLSQVYLLTRLGRLIRLDLDRDSMGFNARGQVLYQAPNDLHSLALTGSAGLIALGHLSSALSVLQTDGQLLWRQHPDDGTATEGQTWTVAFDGPGTRLFIGSAGGTTNVLAALDSRSGVPYKALHGMAGVTALATLAGGSGVAAIVADDPYSGRVAAYSADLDTLLWERQFDESVTALAADEQQAIVVAGVGYEGQIVLLNAQNGDSLAAPFLCRSGINAIALAEGRWLSVATDDAGLALLRYLP